MNDQMNLLLAKTAIKYYTISIIFNSAILGFCLFFSTGQVNAALSLIGLAVTVIQLKVNGDYYTMLASDASASDIDSLKDGCKVLQILSTAVTLASLLLWGLINV